MSQRRELDRHRRQLEEIGEIMRSMKNLAYMETRKLSRLLAAQDQAVGTIEAAAADFLGFHPDLIGTAISPCRVFVLVGSERGFCGDFNEALLRAVPDEGETDTRVIAVGSRLCSRLEESGRALAKVDGPSVAEEVSDTLNRLVRVIGRLQDQEGWVSLRVRYHRNGAADVEEKLLLPPFAAEPGRDAYRYSHAPLLNLRPEVFFAELVEHYLLGVLHAIFYTSLMAENQKRIQHLEGAIRRLDEKSFEYARQSRILRQEEITEEIEVILLSTEGLGAP